MYFDNIHVTSRLDYQPLFGKMNPHFGEDQRPDPGDGGIEPR